MNADILKMFADRISYSYSGNRMFIIKSYVRHAWVNDAVCR